MALIGESTQSIETWVQNTLKAQTVLESSGKLTIGLIRARLRNDDHLLSVDGAIHVVGSSVVGSQRLNVDTKGT